MSMTDRATSTTRPNTEQQRPGRAERRHGWTETRLFAKTSEFWAMIVGVVAIVVIYNAASDSSFDLWRACLLGTALAVGYMVSRGIAKAGTHSGDDDRRESDFRR